MIRSVVWTSDFNTKRNILIQIIQLAIFNSFGIIINKKKWVFYLLRIRFKVKDIFLFLHQTQIKWMLNYFLILIQIHKRKVLFILEKYIGDSKIIHIPRWTGEQRIIFMINPHQFFLFNSVLNVFLWLKICPVKWLVSINPVNISFENIWKNWTFHIFQSDFAIFHF